MGRIGRASSAIASLSWLALAACGGGTESSTPSATVQPIGGSAISKSRTEQKPLDSSIGQAGSMPDAKAVAPVANRPPRFTGVQVSPGRRIESGQDVSVIAHAVDPDGDEVTLEYSWQVNGDSTEETGRVFSTSGLARGDTVQVRVIARDGRSSSDPIDGPELVVQNGLPRVTSLPGAPGADGVFRYQVRAEDPEGDSNFRYRLLESPDGMAISQLGGLVVWTPSADQQGAFPIEIEIEDAGGGTATQKFELRLDASAQPPASRAE